MSNWSLVEYMLGSCLGLAPAYAGVTARERWGGYCEPAATFTGNLPNLKAALK